MKVKLLKDVMEGGKVKTTIRPNRRTGIFWFKDTEIEVSEETGAKLIERGDAEKVDGVATEVAEEG